VNGVSLPPILDKERSGGPSALHFVEEACACMVGANVVKEMQKLRKVHTEEKKRSDGMHVKGAPASTGLLG
jgi:hypothetical protein